MKKSQLLAMTLGVICGALLAVVILRITDHRDSRQVQSCRILVGASFERVCRNFVIRKQIIKYSYQFKIIYMDTAQIEVMRRIENTLGYAYAELIFRESGFHPGSVNGSSGACGLGQANPCEKMGCSLNDIDCQLNWVKNYVTRRYGSPTLALAHHNRKGWY